MTTEPVPMVGGGIIVPWDDKQPIRRTTWAIKIGVCPQTEEMVFETCYDYGIKEHISWTEEHWLPIEGVHAAAHGPGILGTGCKGGPYIFRGEIDPGAALRLRIAEGTGIDIPVHVQVGSLSYVGVISTNSDHMFVINEEMTLEEALKDC